MRRRFEFVDEPRGDVLFRLLRSLVPYSATALLVIHDEFGMSGRAKRLLTELTPFFSKQWRGSEWPGTSTSEVATLMTYHLDRSVVELLAAATDRLYGWRQEELPEDLALLRADGDPLLTTVAHEKLAFLDVTDDELAEIHRMVPEIREFVRPLTPRR